MNMPTLTAYADRLAFLAPTTDESADAGRAVARAIEASGGRTWASFATNEVRVYDLSHLAACDVVQWNGVVEALNDELFALRHGQAVVYSERAIPARTVGTVDAADHDTYVVPGGIRAVFYAGSTHARVEVTMTAETARALVDEISDALPSAAPAPTSAPVQSLAAEDDHGAEVAVDSVAGEVIHEGPGCPGWHAWDEAVYGPRPARGDLGRVRA